MIIIIYYNGDQYIIKVNIISFIYVISRFHCSHKLCIKFIHIWTDSSFVKYKQKLVWVETWKMLGLNLIIAGADTSQACCLGYCSKCSNQQNSKGIRHHRRCAAQKMTYTLSVGKPFKYMLKLHVQKGIHLSFLSSSHGFF